MRQLVGIVQKRGHDPSGGKHEIAVDDFRRDDVPLRAQRILVQIEDLDFILHELLCTQRREDIPM